MYSYFPCRKSQQNCLTSGAYLVFSYVCASFFQGMPKGHSSRDSRPQSSDHFVQRHTYSWCNESWIETRMTILAENEAFPLPWWGQARTGSSGEGRSRKCAKCPALRSLGNMKQFPTFPKRETTFGRYPSPSQEPSVRAKRIATPPPPPLPR